MTPKYNEVWRAMRESEDALRQASDAFGHLLRQLPALGQERLPAPSAGEPNYRAAQEEVARINPIPFPPGPIPCPTPPNCRPPEWSVYAGWLAQVSARVAALSVVVGKIAEDPAAAGAVAAFSETPAYRSGAAPGAA